MSNEMAGVTPEQVERIAAIVAREVVGKLSKELRDDIGQEVNDQLRTYFGDMTPAQHSIQHSNLDKLLNFKRVLWRHYFQDYLVPDHRAAFGFGRLWREKWTAITGEQG